MAESSCGERTTTGALVWFELRCQDHSAVGLRRRPVSRLITVALDSVALRPFLAPHGVLRVALNHANFLLVTAPAPRGEGVAADLGREMARRLDVAVQFVGYDHAGHVADAAGRDEWDVAFIGADPARDEVTFSPAYVGIEATYLVRDPKRFVTVDDVDQDGVRIAVADRSAYHLALLRIIRRAQLVPAAGLPESEVAFDRGGLEVLAGLRPHLEGIAAARSGVHVLGGAFLTVQQAIGVPRGRVEAAQWVAGFVRDVLGGGTVKALVATHGVRGVTVPPSIP
jgi:polar amino acid transport system substrate-binding protein